MNDWYNTDKLDKAAPDTKLKFIVGARRIGKTLHFQKKAFELWDDKHLSTMWVRNKKVELSDPAFINDYLNACHKFGWCHPEDHTNPDGVYNDDGEQIIKFQSISTFSNRRGNMTDNVGRIVFDEFMPEDRKYPKRAHTGLMSLTKTVLSGRIDSDCVCLSNFISSANPYFVGFGIYPEKDKDITVFPDKGIAIEVCRGYKGAIEDGNPWNKIYKAGGYQDYADADEDKLFNLVAKVPKAGQPHHIFLMANETIYGCTFKNGLVYFHEAKPTSCHVFATTLQDTTDKVGLIPRFFREQIKEWSELNVLRFATPNVMYAILSIVYDVV